MAIWKYVRIVGVLAGGAIGTMTQVGPDELVSNVSKWWERAFGAPPPDLLRNPFADDLTTIIGGVIVAALLLPVASRWLWRRFGERQFPKANLAEWRIVDPLLLWQAGCLWKGIKPMYPVAFLNPAYSAFSMLLRAAEHGQLPLVKREPDEKFAYSQVSRDELAKFAIAKRESPDFLRDLLPRFAVITAVRSMNRQNVISALAVVGAVLGFGAALLAQSYQTSVCVPETRWQDEEVASVDSQLNEPAVVRGLMVTRLSYRPYRMQIEAQGPGLRNLNATWPGATVERAVKRQLKPNGIGLQLDDPAGLVMVAVTKQRPSDQIAFTIKFECK